MQFVLLLREIIALSALFGWSFCILVLLLMHAIESRFMVTLGLQYSKRKR